MSTQDGLSKWKVIQTGLISIFYLIPRRHDLIWYLFLKTWMAESEEELKHLLMKVKEESKKAGWKLNIQKTKIMASGPITLWQIDGKKTVIVTDYFLGFQNHCGWWLQPWN